MPINAWGQMTCKDLNLLTSITKTWNGAVTWVALFTPATGECGDIYINVDDPQHSSKSAQMFSYKKNAAGTCVFTSDALANLGVAASGNYCDLRNSGGAIEISNHATVSSGTMTANVVLRRFA